METRLYASQNAVTIRFRAKKTSFPASKTLTALTDYPRFFIGMPVVRMDGRSVYGHVITKFSRMSRFTYPWCSAGARLERESSAINDLPKILKHSAADIYADDTTISANVDYRSAPGALNQVLQAHVGKVAQWTTDNKMVLNESKTKTMLVAGKRLHKKMSSSLSI